MYFPNFYIDVAGETLIANWRPALKTFRIVMNYCE